MHEIQNAKVKEVHKAETGVSKSSGKEWKKQSIAITFGDQYPKDLALDVWNDKPMDLNTINEGDTVSVKFDVESQSYNGKYYTSAKCYYIKVEQTNNATKDAPASYAKVESQKAESEHTTDDGLPF